MKLRQARKILDNRIKQRIGTYRYRGSTLARAHHRVRRQWWYGQSPLTGIAEAFAMVASSARQAALAMGQACIPLAMLFTGRSHYGSAKADSERFTRKVTKDGQ